MVVSDFATMKIQRTSVGTPAPAGYWVYIKALKGLPQVGLPHLKLLLSCPFFALRLTPVRGSGASDVYGEDFLSGASLLCNPGKLPVP